MNITMQDKYQTRDGRAVRILAVDMKSQGALIGIEDPRLSEPQQRLLERRRAEAGIVGVR